MSSTSLVVCSACGAHVKPTDFFCHVCGVTLAVKPRVDSMKGYIQMIGAIEIVFGVMALIGGMLLAVLTAIIPRLIMMDDFSHYMDSDMPGFLREGGIITFITVFLGLIALLFIIYAIVSFVSGARLLQYKNSGRIGTMVIGALNLFNFPFGTAFGLAALYVLTRPETEQLFRDHSRNGNNQRYYYPVSQ